MFLVTINGTTESSAARMAFASRLSACARAASAACPGLPIKRP